MKKYLFILFVIAVFFRPDHLYSQKTQNSELNYHIAYFGNSFINPGLSFQIETIFKENKIQFLSNSFRTDYVGSATLAGYWDPFSHTGIQYFIDYSRRLYLTRRISLQMGAGIGWMMIYLPESYKYTDSGEIKKSVFNTHSFIAPEVSSGWRISNKKGDKSIGSRLIIHFPWRYNLYTIPVISYELTYQF
jgi:hypothetical protein